MNQIPTSLARPLLRDAIVEFTFRAASHETYVAGQMYEYLRHLGWNLHPTNSSNAVFRFGPDFLTSAGEVPSLIKDSLRVQILPFALTFNFNQPYPGWRGSYLPHISNICEVLDQAKVALLQRVGLRFVNELPNEDIFLLSNRTPRSFTSFTIERRQVSLTIIQNDIEGQVNLANGLSGSDGQDYSLIDVDLQIDFSNNDVSFAQGLQRIQDLHALNKQIIFGELLPMSFVEKFGPTYEH